MEKEAGFVMFLISDFHLPTFFSIYTVFCLLLQFR